MGYYSNYELTSIAGTSIDDIPDFSSCFEGITSYLFSEDMYDMKWYSAEDDMVRISTRYPDTVFRLSWSGEDSDDQGIAYFWNGKHTIEYLPTVPEPKLANLPGFAEAHPELLL